MRLDKGAIRELHWHKEAEWAYVLEGEVRITALDYEGGSYFGDLKKGDLWYFPSGIPHSLQGLGENGTEFLLIFDSGTFSEESTFVLTDWFGKYTAYYVPCILCTLGIVWPDWLLTMRSSYTEERHSKELSFGARGV